MEGRLDDAAFDGIFGDAVLTGLANILGPSGTQATIKYMGLGPSPRDPDKVDAALVAVFQKPGALVIERQIVRALFDKLDERYPDEHHVSFGQRVDEVRRRFEATGRARG
jgi:hypothetical protein